MYKEEDLVKMSAAQLTDIGVCPTCFNRSHGGIIFGDDSQTLIYRDKDIECFFAGNPRADGHICISSVEHYHDLSQAPDYLNEKIIRFAKRIMQFICEIYKCERVYLCTMCDGLANHYHVQLIPRYSYEKRGSVNFVKVRKAYVYDEQKLAKMKELVFDYAKTQENKA